MLPRPSTTMSFQPSSEMLLRSACRTIDPSGSIRRSSLPETRRRPSGNQSMDHPKPAGALLVITSLFPFMSTATISPVFQWANHNLPSCQRAISGMASPESRTLGEELDDGCNISASFFTLFNYIFTDKREAWSGFGPGALQGHQGT